MAEPAGVPPPPEAPDQEEIEAVNAAIAAGLWKVKTDPRTNRKYYINSRTKQGTWNLAKELRKVGQLRVKAEEAEALSKKERGERTRQRAEVEVQTASHIALLEQEKIALEVEVARLRAPVETETAKLEHLRRQVTDKKYSIDAVHREARARRNERHTELQAILANLTNLQSVVDNDAAFKESVEAKHRQLLVESMELSSDLERERSAAETLKVSVKEAEHGLSVASEELKALQSEIQRRDELARIVEDDLRSIAKRKAEANDAILDAKRRKADLEAKVAKSQRITAQARELGNGSVKQLTEQYQAKVRTLETLAKMEEQVDDVKLLEHSNMKLRMLISNAQADDQALKRLASMLEAELKRLTDVVVVTRTDCAAVAKTLAELEKTMTENQAFFAIDDASFAAHRPAEQRPTQQ